MDSFTVGNVVAYYRNFLTGLLVLSATGLMPLRAAADNLSVAMMPSYNQQTTYGNTLINSNILVWGRVFGGSGTYTNYTLDFGDGTAVTGAVADATSIGQDHAYASGGSKTATLIVRDDTGAAATNTAVIKVFSTPTHDICVNMAVEKGLYWIYRNQTTSDTNTSYWASYGGEYDLAASGFSLTALEENGHYMYNDYRADIYADTVRKGLNWILNKATVCSISQQTYGNPDSNGNGKGVYLYDGIYANAIGTSALIMSQPSAQAASNTIIRIGACAGTNLFDLVNDIFDQYSYCQGEGAYRGGWRYSITSSDSPAEWGGQDGSAQQWPNINFAAAMDRWNLGPAAWVINHSMVAWSQLMADDGSIGYDGAGSEPNLGKTGGALTGYKVGQMYNYPGMTNGNAIATNALGYIGRQWDSDWGGWAGDFYAMYGAKKGLFLQGITTVSNATFGARDWYNDMSAWLLGNTSNKVAQYNMPYVPATLLDDYQSPSYAFGQASDGSWLGSVGYMPSVQVIDTPVAILILTKAVTVESPVAVIASVGTQSKHEGRPPTPFVLNGSGSYHQDPGKAVVEWLWNWGTNAVDWAHPDASGQKPTHPGYNAVGAYTVTLRVKDNSTPTPLYSTATLTVNVLDQNVAPVAIPIPAGIPAYSGRVGDTITLDGSASYDPDGDTITNYIWDVNGNNVYGDAGDISTTNPTTTITFGSAYVGAIGLQVSANGLSAHNAVQINIYAALSDLSVVSFTASSVVPDASADVHATLLNDAASARDFNNVVVRFYNGDPLNGGSQLSTNCLVNLPKNTPVALDTHLAGLSGVSHVYVYVDANDAIPEWNETNNTAHVSVSYPPIINSFNQITNGTFMVEFSAVLGKTYFIQYTSALSLPWITVSPSIVATVNNMQWIDSGPPATESAPNTVPSRFYQVIQVNP